MGAIEIAIRVFAGVLLILANAMFVAVEFAMTRLRQFSEEEFQDSGSLQRAWEMTDELEIYLTGCQVGISLSSILLGIIAEPAVTHLLEPLFDWVGITGKTAAVVSIILSVFLINFAHKIWGEQTPTYMGVERPKAVAKLLAPFLYWWAKIMYPLIIAGDSIAKWTLSLFGIEMTRSWTDADEGEEGEGESIPDAGTPEFRRRLVEVLSQARVGKERREEIVRAYEIGEKQAHEIMIPYDEMTVLDADRDFSENLETMQGHHYTRYPLSRGATNDPSDFVGVVYLPAVVAELEALQSGEMELEDLAGQPVCVEHDTPIDKVVDLLQEAGEEMAMIQRDGELIGAVTSTDSFEAIIGNLEDPFD